MPSQKIETIKVKDLVLWTENPRDPINKNATDLEIIKKAIDNEQGKWDLHKLIKEMGGYYDFSELPTVVKFGKKYIVYDGNRRISILKCIQDDSLYQIVDGGLNFPGDYKLLKEQIEIPCNVCDEETALANTERKHASNGTWKPLERLFSL